MQIKFGAWLLWGHKQRFFGKGQYRHETNGSETTQPIWVGLGQSCCCSHEHTCSFVLCKLLHDECKKKFTDNLNHLDLNTGMFNHTVKTIVYHLLR